MSAGVAACGFRFGREKPRFLFLWRGFWGHSFYQLCYNAYRDDLLGCTDTVDQNGITVGGQENLGF